MPLSGSRRIDRGFDVGKGKLTALVGGLNKGIHAIRNLFQTPSQLLGLLGSSMLSRSRIEVGLKLSMAYHVFDQS